MVTWENAPPGDDTTHPLGLTVCHFAAVEARNPGGNIVHQAQIVVTVWYQTVVYTR